MKETVTIEITAEALSDIINCGEDAALALMTMMLILNSGGYCVPQSCIYNNPAYETNSEEVSLGFDVLMDLGFLEMAGEDEDGEMMYSVTNGVCVNDPEIPFR